MKIATVTLNPAIDQTVWVDHFQPNHVNRSRAIQFHAGGKGVNVASFLADYGCQVTVTGFLGAENPALFEQLFAGKQIVDRFVRIPGYTRTNIKIVDEAHQQTTDINLQGLTPSAQAMEQLQEAVEQLADECDWFALSGNLPPGVPTEIYAGIIAQIKAHHKAIALDTSRDALQKGIAAGPTLIKPNIHELEQLVGYPLKEEKDILQAAKQLLTHNIQWVVVSMGEKGALFVTQNRTARVIPPAVTVKSTVGAGDAMVAGLIAGQSQGLGFCETAQLATAFSLAAITHVGAQLPTPQTLQSYVNQVSVIALD